jgi:hypothetical protein
VAIQYNVGAVLADIDVPNTLEVSLMRPAEVAARDRKELLRDVAVTMRHARIFITSREKMHPTGIELYDQLLDEIRLELREPS